MWGDSMESLQQTKVYKEHIQEKLALLPEAPGIYRMLDKDGRIIYIGKSKCLKKRVHSYFVPSPQWDKARRMVPHIEDISWQETDTHLEAMLLECRLIKEIRPFYNVLMKNDGHYCYLTVGDKPSKPLLSVTYERAQCSFGPFRRRDELETLATAMRNFYPLKERDNRFVLVYQILPNTLTKREYEECACILKRIFGSRDLLACFRDAVWEQMQAFAAEEKFELAMRCRDCMKSLDYIRNALEKSREWTARAWLYTEQIEGGIKAFYISGGELIHSAVYKKWNAKREEGFLRTARKKEEKQRARQTTEDVWQEKGRLDYCDILYAYLQEEGGGKEVDSYPALPGNVI